MNQETEIISVESVEEFFARAKRQGIAEGLRMAGEIAIASGIYDNGIRTRDDIWKAILAKAKEVEEGK